MAVNQVLAGLDDVFKLLVGGRQGAPVRHQTLRAALDWSYDMLQPTEQAALRRLSVFGGSFSLAAAQAVATLGGAGAGAERGGGENRAGAGAERGGGKDRADPADVLDLLARLVDRSLLLVEHTPAQARYRMLATVRRYGAQRLTESGEFAAASETMFAWYLDLAGTLRLATALVQFWYLRGHYREARDWLDWALAAPDGAPAEVRAKGLQGSGMLAHLQCEYPAAVRRLEGALALYRELGNRRGVAGILSSLGSVAREQSRYARARELQTEALAEFE